MTNRSKKGFTLIELLVVIAIIGILASVVLASLNSARAKSRDARRIADVKQIQLALELYYDANSQHYPAILDALIGGCSGSTNCIPVVPIPPQTALQATYAYSPSPSGCTGGAAGTCVSYHMGAVLEEGTNQAIATDIDSLDTGTTPFSGLSVACTATAGTAAPAGTERCYDLTN